jgi:hypothetical protein
MYPTNRKSKPVDYDAGLELGDVIKFIRRFATVPLVEDYTEIMIGEGSISGGK